MVDGIPRAAGVNSGRLDMYYIAPDGKRMRSMSEVYQYLGLSAQPAKAVRPVSASSADAPRSSREAKIYASAAISGAPRAPPARWACRAHHTGPYVAQFVHLAHRTKLTLYLVVALSVCCLGMSERAQRPAVFPHGGSMRIRCLCAASPNEARGRRSAMLWHYTTAMLHIREASGTHDRLRQCQSARLHAALFA